MGWYSTSAFRCQASGLRCLVLRFVRPMTHHSLLTTRYSPLITRHFRKRLTLVVVTGLCLFVGCASEPHPTDAALGLTPPQAQGRRVFEQRCQECHFAYIARNLRGP